MWLIPKALIVSLIFVPSLFFFFNVFIQFVEIMLPSNGSGQKCKQFVKITPSQEFEYGLLARELKLLFIFFFFLH